MKHIIIIKKIVLSLLISLNLLKSQDISLDGEIRTRKYDKDGQTHYVTEVLCSSFQLLESRAQRAVRENNPDNDLADLILEEELPF